MDFNTIQKRISLRFYVFPLKFYKCIESTEKYDKILDAGDDIPGIGQYEDFHTIDWQRDIARDRMRHRYIIKKIQYSVWDFIKVFFVKKLISFISFISNHSFTNREHTTPGQDGCVFY